MKRQPRGVRAFLAIAIVFFSVMQPARAQIDQQAVLLETYYQTKGSDTVVLRLIKSGELISVYGAGTGIVPPQPDGLLGSLIGAYDPVSQQIRLTVQQARGNPLATSAIHGSGLGYYNPATRSFSVTFTSDQGETQTFDNIALHTGPVPYVVGIWFWTAASSPGLLFTNPTYGGEFHITGQDPDGKIRGSFGRTNPSDVGAIDGIVTPDQVFFTRSGNDAAGVPFTQGWGGSLTDDKIGILGAIEQNVPVPWSGDFEARWLRYRH